MTEKPGRLAASVVAKALKAGGSDMAFGVPGGGPNLDVVGAMADNDIRFVLAHGETSACVMASVYGYLTATLSAAVVTRGPGAAAAVNGAAQATLDRHPLALITDTVPAATAERVPHQRIDQRAMFTPVSKVSVTVGSDAKVEDLNRLLAVATAAPAGTVHLDFDAETQTNLSSLETIRFEADASRADAAPRAADSWFADKTLIDEAAALLSAANRPVVIVGLGAVAAPGLIPLLETIGAPVLTTYQAIGTIPTEHDLCAGLFTNGAAEAGLLERSDLIIAIGLDPVEPIPAAWAVDVPVVALAELALSDPYYPVTVELVGPLPALFDAVAAAGGPAPASRWGTDDGARYRESTRSALTAGSLSPGHGSPGVDTSQAGVSPVDLVNAVAAASPETATVTVDAGAHFLAIMPLWPVSGPKRLLISNGLATMGYAVPAAIAAALARPGAPVLCLVGDGGLGMTVAELETMVRLELPITVVVFNDSALSLIRIKQQKGHGGSDAVAYRHSDFAAMAQAMGMAGTAATDESELAEALATCRWDQPSLIDVRVDPDQYPHLIAVTRG